MPGHTPRAAPHVEAKDPEDAGFSSEHSERQLVSFLASRVVLGGFLNRAL